MQWSEQSAQKGVCQPWGSILLPVLTLHLRSEKAKIDPNVFSYAGWQNWPSRSQRTIPAFLKGAWQLAVPSVLARSEE